MGLLSVSFAGVVLRVTSIEYGDHGCIVSGLAHVYDAMFFCKGVAALLIVGTCSCLFALPHVPLLVQVDVFVIPVSWTLFRVRKWHQKKGHILKIKNACNFEG